MLVSLFFKIFAGNTKYLKLKVIPDATQHLCV